MPTALGTIASGYKATAAPIPTTGLLAWWDADDASTFTFSSGNQFSKWNDKSGANNHAEWVNSSWPATRIPGGINGKAAVDFDPSALNTTMASNIKPVTMIAAVNTGPDNAVNTALLGQAYGTPNIDVLSWDMNAGTMRLMRANVALIGQATSPFTPNVPAVLGVSYGSDDVWTHYRNGATVGTGTTAGTFAPGTFALGGLAVANTPVSWQGLLGEMVIYNRVLSTVERQQVESYLTAKWIPTVATFPTLAASNTETGTAFAADNAIPAPAGVAAGDLVIAFCTLDGGNTLTASTGWTQIITSASVSAHRISVWGRVADGGVNDALALTPGATNDYCASTHRITGHGVTNVATDIKAAQFAVGTTGTNPDPPSLDAGSTKHWLWLTATSFDRIAGSDTITTAPTNYTFVGSVLASATTTSSSVMAVAQRSLQTQTEDPGTFTSTTTARSWQAVTIAIPGGTP